MDLIKKSIIDAFQNVFERFSLKKTVARKICSTCYEFIFVNTTSGLKIIYDLREGWLDIRIIRLINGLVVEDPHTGWLESKLNEISLDYIVSYFNLESCIKPIYSFPEDSVYHTSENGFFLYCQLYVDQILKYCSEILSGNFNNFDNFAEYMKHEAIKRKETLSHK